MRFAFDCGWITQIYFFSITLKVIEIALAENNLAESIITAKFITKR